jgi:hypothetical protein
MNDLINYERSNFFLALPQQLLFWYFPTPIPLRFMGGLHLNGATAPQSLRLMLVLLKNQDCFI